MDGSDRFLVLLSCFLLEVLPLQCSVSQIEKDSPSRARFYCLQLHYVNGVFDAKIHHEEVDVL